MTTVDGFDPGKYQLPNSSMMKQLRFFLLTCLIAGSLNSYVHGENWELRTSQSVLTVGPKGDIKISRDNRVILSSSAARLWSITLENKDEGKRLVLTPEDKIQVRESKGAISLARDYSTPGQAPVVSAEFSIAVKDDAFCFSGRLGNKSAGWTIREVRFPDFSGEVPDAKDTAIYWPTSLGERYTNPREFGKKTAIYPGTWGSMPWFSVNSQGNGLYIACHDPERTRKDFSLQWGAATSFQTSVTFPVNQSAFDIPDVIVKPYAGAWHNAARTYRSWFDRNFTLPRIDPWIRENAGLMLIIFKQQNGNVMWRYKDIDRLCDIAGKLNYKLIGLWGWGVGGHDRLYPNFLPDYALGGRKELEAAIERAHQRGFRVIMYVNGNIMDVSTDFYAYNGLETAHLNEEMDLNFESFIKYNYITPVVFARGCPGSKTWRKAIQDAVLNVQSLGADAVHVDQVGVKSAYPCYSKHHDHVLPQEAFAKYRVKMMQDIRGSLKERDPDFLLMTEGTLDLLMTQVDVFHGLGPGSVITPNAFPSMFRYTFPESIIIQLNAIPMLPRYEANYAAVHGIRHEIMCRYEADADYLASGKMPNQDDYKTVNSPPVLEKILEVSPEEAAAYSHRLIQFENEHKAFFRNGTFVDEQGFHYTGKDILARGFVNGSRMGVVVWNMNVSESREVSVSVPGYRFVSAAEPGKTDVKTPSALGPNSLRLLVYEKQ